MKLDPNDLQFENFTNFDGTYAYSQNKVPHLNASAGVAISKPHPFPCNYSASASCDDQEVGGVSPPDPFLFHAPRLGRHS